MAKLVREQMQEIRTAILDKIAYENLGTSFSEISSMVNRAAILQIALDKYIYKFIEIDNAIKLLTKLTP